MATLMIRNMHERVKAELRVLAACRGVSMEQHARDILEQAVASLTHDEPFALRIQRRFNPVAIETLRLPARQPPRLAHLRGSIDVQTDWLNQKTQSSLADPAPNVPHASAMRGAQAIIDSKQKQHARRARKTSRA